jgi:glycosyltransferase involved in cell wall biosynthesis
MRRPTVVLLRGTAANPWDLRVWEHLADDFDVRVLVPASNRFSLGSLDVPAPRVLALSDLIPRGQLRRLAARSPYNAYVGLDAHLRDAEIVHATEIGSWFAAQAAAQRRRLGFRLALTVWETIPFLRTYRDAPRRAYRARALAAADLLLPTTERARAALLLEGASPDRIRVAPPGVAVDRFSDAARSAQPPAEHLIVSPARLIWEKGHQDVMRALAALRRGIVNAATPSGQPRLLIVGAGSEARRLRAYAADLGIANIVEFRAQVPYDEMPDIYARASCLVLASLPTPLWEEQFGMVLAEAMAAGLPIVASASGAIPEVLGDDALLFSPGDWLGLAHTLADGPLAQPPGQRRSVAPERLAQYSTAAAAERMRDAYTTLLAH